MPMNGLRTCVEDHLTTYTMVYFWGVSSIPLYNTSAFILAKHCFAYSSFVTNFQIRKNQDKTLCSLSHGFRYLRSLEIPYEL